MALKTIIFTIFFIYSCNASGFGHLTAIKSYPIVRYAPFYNFPNGVRSIHAVAPAPLPAPVFPAPTAPLFSPVARLPPPVIPRVLPAISAPPVFAAPALLPAPSPVFPAPAPVFPAPAVYPAPLFASAPPAHVYPAPPAFIPAPAPPVVANPVLSAPVSPPLLPAPAVPITAYSDHFHLLNKFSTPVAHSPHFKHAWK